MEAESEFGARTVLEALDADQELLDSQVALVTARRNKVVAAFSLLSVLGRLRPDNLGFAESLEDYDRYFDDFKWQFFNMDVDRLSER